MMRMGATLPEQSDSAGSMIATMFCRRCGAQTAMTDGPNLFIATVVFTRSVTFYCTVCEKRCTWIPLARLEKSDGTVARLEYEAELKRDRLVSRQRRAQYIDQYGAKPFETANQVARWDSMPERLLGEEMRRSGLRPNRQYRLLSRYRADFAFPDAMLIVEADGDYWHRLPDAVEKDRRRDAALAKAGWTVLRIWETDILSDVYSCVTRVHAALAERVATT